MVTPLEPSKPPTECALQFKLTKEHVASYLEGCVSVQSTVVRLLGRDMLSVVQGTRRIESLKNITLNQLLQLPLANVETNVGYGLPGYEHAAVDVFTELKLHLTIEQQAQAGMSSLFMEDDQEACENQLEIKSHLQALDDPQTRSACKEFVLEILCRDRMSDSLLDCLTTPPSPSGFHNQFYLGSPEEVQAGLRAHGGFTWNKPITRIVFRQPVEDLLLSVFRVRSASEGSNRNYLVEAVFHNTKDELIAKVGLVFNYELEDANPSDIVMSLDETADQDCQEAAVGMALHLCEEDDPSYWMDCMTRVVVIRDWNVRVGDQHKGIGRKLLGLALKYGRRGLPKPRLLALRLEPAQYEFPPFSNQASRMPAEFLAPYDALERYWHDMVVPCLHRTGELPDEVFFVPYLACMHNESEHAILLAIASVNEKVDAFLDAWYSQ